MGCAGSVPEEEKRSAAIDAELKRDERETAKDVKCLLLGSGESGKSTILKQMRHLSEGPLPNHERLAYREIIMSNCVQSMQVVCEALEELQLVDSLPEGMQRYLDLFASLDVQPDVMDREGTLHAELGEGIIALWQTKAVKDCVQQSHTYQLNDSAPYYFDEAPRIAMKGYIPTDQDILRSRVRTTGIMEVKYNLGKLTLRCFDVGGQRSERRKWVSCFEGVHCLFFVVAVSEYNQLLVEDSTTNRVVEAATLFDSVVNSRWFQEAGVLLFFNKTDLLEAKLQTHPFRDSFPDFTGENKPVPVQTWYKNKFASLYRHQWRELFPHFTCATDTKQMEVVLAAVEQHILLNNLSKTGML